MTSSSRAGICDLPDEVLLSVFSLLPVPDLARCAATCERWRALVTGFSLLWRGKCYRSFRSPADCADTRAVLHALPPLQEVVLDSDNGFVLSVFYPSLALSLKYVRVIEDCPRLRCHYLAARLDIAGDIFSQQSTVDLDGLRHLRIMPVWPHNTWAQHEYSAGYVVRVALSLCPNLTRLSVCVDAPSLDYLEAVEALARLEWLELDCAGARGLALLGRCSARLRRLHLLGCGTLPSRHLVRLRPLAGLRDLHLADFRFRERDLAVTVAALPALEALRLAHCGPLRDLSALRHCPHLRRLCVTAARLLEPLKAAGAAGLRLGELRLLTAPQGRPLRAAGLLLAADSLPAALARLEALGLARACLDHLRPLACCPQLSHVCCEFARGPREPQLFSVRIHITITDPA